MAVPDLIQFVNGTAADADEVNQNFDLVSDFIDTDCMVLDGSKTFTGNVDIGGNQLLRVATPTADTDGANKLYADSVIPVGVVQMFVGGTVSIPAKWVECDGQELNRTTYSELFNIIGEAYGVGDGVSTFNVPNMAGFFPYGAAPGAEGGSADAVTVTHTHEQNEHRHLNNPPNTNPDSHNHDMVGDFLEANTGNPSGTMAAPDYPGFNTNTTPPTDSDQHVHSMNDFNSNYATATNQDAGEDGTGKNIPPYKGFTFIIRTGV